MSDLTDITQTASITYCARGCTRYGQHLTACEDRDSCAGCLPRQAEYGLLCFGCHKRLTNLLGHASGQVSLLALMAALSGEVELTAPTLARIPSGWRVADSEPYARMHAAAMDVAHSTSEPLRLGCLDAVQEVRDRLDLWTCHLVADYAMAGPAEDKPADYSEFLLTHIARLEQRAGIGDELEEFMDIMSRSHSLAPWRESVARLPAIPCPECTSTTLVMFGGDDFVTCLRCRATMTKERYGIWTKILAEDHREAAAG